MPRKSTASASASGAPPKSPTSPTTAQADTSVLSTTEPKSPKSPTAKSKKQQDDNVGIDDLLLPRSLTSRLARGILPPNTSIQKDAVLALTKSATVFISYLASHANELTSKKTITPEDVLKAIKEVELEGVMELGRVGEDGRRGGRLERELEVFEGIVRGKRKGYREKVKARESGGSTLLEGAGGGDGERERGEPASKKMRRMDDDGDEELLDAQLNGSDDVDVGGPSNGTGRVFEREGGDETEDDPEVVDQEDEQDQDQDDDQDDAPEDEEEQPEHIDNDEDRIDLDDDDDGRRMVLAPNGRAEVGSEDESD